MKVSKEISIDIEKLVNACLKNDRKAQIQLYELYAKRMFNTSLRITQDAMLAEDIVQESFIKAFSSLSTFRNEVPFVSWLQKIVINRSLDELRRRKHFVIMNEEKLKEIEIADEPPEESIYSSEVLLKIKDIMNELSEGYRVIFSLYFFEGYDHDEISQILNINASTSRSQLVRAKKKILEKLNFKIDSHV
jgi:RNA polymerase sigma factor (sigma-70 family)